MRPLRVGVLVVVVLAMSGVALSLLAGVPRPDGWRAIGARLLGSPAPAPAPASAPASAPATGSLHAAAAGGAGGVPEPGQRSQRGFDPRQLLDRGRGTLQSPAGPHEFYFTRAIYRSGGWRGQPWATDFPKSDRQFMTIVNRLIEIDASERENAIRLDDPNIGSTRFSTRSKWVTSHSVHQRSRVSATTCSRVAFSSLMTSGDRGSGRRLNGRSGASCLSTRSSTSRSTIRSSTPSIRLRRLFRSRPSTTTIAPDMGI